VGAAGGTMFCFLAEERLLVLTGYHVGAALRCVSS
jgi:hypothetical protein